MSDRRSRKKNLLLKSMGKKCSRLLIPKLQLRNVDTFKITRIMKPKLALQIYRQADLYVGDNDMCAVTTATSGFPLHMESFTLSTGRFHAQKFGVKM